MTQASRRRLMAGRKFCVDFGGIPTRTLLCIGRHSICGEGQLSKFELRTGNHQGRKGQPSSELRVESMRQTGD
jgi:hypothetical protein